MTEDDDLPPLERDGQPIINMPWPVPYTGCNECGNTVSELYRKKVLWNMTNDLVVYINMNLCPACWPLIGWEAWTPPSTLPFLDEYLECLWNNAG
jgi:hypothetical protein